MSEVDVIKAWFDSEEGIRCCDGATQGEYLRNRLWRALTAGIAAGRRLERAETLERVRKLLSGE
jgi:hypothetical protein